jgi:nucleotide-binding universal stress UspA family protein
MVEGSDFLLVAGAVWVTVGIVTSVLMGRRGHDAFGWLVIGTVLGPLSIPIALRSIREERMAQGQQIEAGGRGGGVIDVLVGVDGSAEALDAARRAGELLADRIDRFVLAGVIGHEDPASGWSREADAVAALRSMSDDLPERDPGIVVLEGRPADALARYAAEEGFALIVVGRRGRGASKAILGSTARRLSERPGVPVLLI